MAKHRVVCGAALAGVLASLPGPAGAAELAASGPRECADAAEISFRVERSVGMPLAEAAPLKFEVLLERAASGYSARIAVTSAEPERAPMERVLTAPDCGKLVDAVSVAVALALGVADASPDGASAGAARERESAAPASAHATAEIAAVAAERSPLPAPPADAGAGGRGSPAKGALTPSLSLWLLGDAGSLPSPSLGAALGAELAWGRLELRALGTLLFEREVHVESPSAPAPGATLDLLAGGLLACTAPFGSPQAALSPRVCLGAELGRLAGAGTDVAAPRRGSTLWAAPLVQVGGSWAIPDTSLRLGIALLAAAPLNRDEFALRDIGTVHQPPSVIGRLSVGIGVRFD